MAQAKETVVISVVSAMWNERETLPALVQRIHEAPVHVRHEIIIVDESSPDGTYALASKLAEKDICKKRRPIRRAVDRDTGSEALGRRDDRC